MPSRGFADFISAFLRIVSVIYFLVQLALFILGILGGHIDLGGMIAAILFTVMGFGLGILIDIGISIERRLYPSGHQ